MPRLRLTFLVAFVFVVLSVAGTAIAGPVPSQASSSQITCEREADLAIVRDVVSIEPVELALAAQGFTAEEIEQKVAQLSNDDLHQLAQNLDQLHAAAGLTRDQWKWITLAVVGSLLIAASV